MVETNDRRLPVGIQSFEKIRKDGYLYVDKTDIIWQLANRNKTYNYLSCPRRFGKSVLVDTLEAYFMGKKELFEGLNIMQLETEWVKRPVIRLDIIHVTCIDSCSYLSQFSTFHLIATANVSSAYHYFKNIMDSIILCHIFQLNVYFSAKIAIFFD